MEYIDPYDNWTKLIWSLKTGDYYDEAKILSMRSKHYKEKEFDKIYNDFKQTRNNFSLNTFYHYAKISNEKEFYNIKSKYHNFQELEFITDNDIAKTFMKLYGENYLHYDKQYYFFNGLYWQKDGEYKIETQLAEDLSIFYLDEYKRRLKNNNNNHQDKRLLSIINKLGNKKNQKYIVDSIIKYIHKTDVEFEQNKNLLVFKNVIFDVQNIKFIKKGNPEDYMILNTNIDYVQPSEQTIKELDDIINTIFTNKETKKLYLQILYSGLISEGIENFFIANGRGRNGKGLINELYAYLMGEYFYNAPNSILLNELKGGNNQQLANMNYKRVCVYREPDTKGYNKLNISTIKEITGGDQINAVAKYSTKDKVHLRATHILECNDKPNISGNSLDDGAIDRICDIPFTSYFTKDDKEVNNINVFKCNPFFKTKEFKKKYCIALLHIICRNKYEGNLIIPDFIKERSLNYLMECDDILTTFLETFELTDNKKDFIKINDLFCNYKQSDAFINLSKADKQQMNRTKFINKIKEHKYFKKYYKARYNNVREVIINHKIINEDESDDDINL